MPPLMRPQSVDSKVFSPLRAQEKLCDILAVWEMSFKVGVRRLHVRLDVLRSGTRPDASTRARCPSLFSRNGSGFRMAKVGAGWQHQ